MNKSRKLIITGIAGIICISFPTAASELWQRVTLNKSSGNSTTASALYQVDKELLKERVSQTKSGDSAMLTVPLPDGETLNFILAYDSILSSEMEALYPELKTFKGYSTENPDYSGRFDYTPKGFHGMFNYGGEIVYVEPSTDEPGYYTSYTLKSSGSFEDQVLQVEQQKLSAKAEKTSANGNTELRTYRLIVSASGEYSQYHGGTEALARAAIVTAINRVNEVYEADLAVRLNLVNFNIYTDPDTDPFTNVDATTDIELNHADLIEKFGSTTFDVGHLFTTGAGGLAGLGVVCNDSNKGLGVTGTAEPESDAYYIDYVAHELGHQFGANHTFNGTEWSCSGSNRNDSTAYEPGSGSTIMAYAGICGNDDLQSHSDAYFHAASLAEINGYLDSVSCGSAEELNNKPPVVDAGNDYTVPASTPFLLSGSATDANESDTLTYTWEQGDAGTGNSALTTDLGSGPLFRSWTPSTEAIRYIPRLQDIISGSLTTGETYATTNRDVNFRLTVRDGNGGVAHDDILITVDADSGPFEVLSPYAGENVSKTTLVEWNTAGTDTAPVSCSQVDILLSVDNGISFSKTLLSAVDNNGSQSIDLSTYALDTAYLMVKCSDNIFFALSKPFSIQNSSTQSSNSSGGTINFMTLLVLVCLLRRRNK